MLGKIVQSRNFNLAVLPQYAAGRGCTSHICPVVMGPEPCYQLLEKRSCWVSVTKPCAPTSSGSGRLVMLTSEEIQLVWHNWIFVV